MKVAVSGKGGVGKTTIAASVALILARRGVRVLAVDADPDANLASALGIRGAEQKGIVTIARHQALIEERTGAKPGEMGRMFKLNPEVSDIADRFAFHRSGVDLLVLGAVISGGSGCACPENTLLRSLIRELVLYRDQALVIDMEAGIEHLGRGTAEGVDCLVVVVEPGQRAVDSARRIVSMAGDIGVRDVRLVLNKVRSGEDEHFVRESLPGMTVLGVIPRSDALTAADRDGMSVLDAADPAVLRELEAIADALAGKKS
jgi:CO dehydrogenase maturation factor